MVQNRAQRLKAVRREAWDEGVFMDILSRLPVKSICSFKTVCKSWHSLTSEKYFAKKQLAHSRQNPTFITCPSMDRRMKLYSMKPGSFELSTINTIDPAERSKEKYFMYMISSFNGLICCINKVSEEDFEDNDIFDLQIWICNPCTGETLLLPQGRPSFHIEPSVGIAYASDISDYKVFRIFSSGNKIPDEIYTETCYPYAFVLECEVYSSTTGSWKYIGPVPRCPMEAGLSPYRSSHVFLGGKIYWLVSLGDSGEILSVDLEGRFEVISLPLYEDVIRTACNE